MKIVNYKLKIVNLSLLITGCLFLFLVPLKSNAETISLSVSPQILKIEQKSPSETSTPLTLTNNETNSLKIKVLFKPFRPSGEAGQIEYLNESQIPPSYDRILKYSKITEDGIAKNEFDLGPKQQKDLKLYINIPKNESTTADYYYSVVFLASPSAILYPSSSSQESEEEDPEDSILENNPSAINENDYHNYSIINTGIAVNILLSVNPGRISGKIEEFSAPRFTQSGPINFTVRVRNTGQNTISPTGTIYIKNMFGQTIGKLDLNQDNILSNSARSLTSQTSPATASSSATSHHNNPQEDKPKITWDEKFLLGPYTATLNLSISNKGPIYNQTFRFLALPIHIVIILILSLIIITAIVIRVRYRLKIDD